MKIAKDAARIGQRYQGNKDNKMTTVKSRTAEAIAPMLSGFHAIGDRPLLAVWYTFIEGMLGRIALDFGEVSLVFDADENDDSIDIAVSTIEEDNVARVDASDSDPWRSFVGEPFGWGWVTVNMQGYCDGVLLSFSGVVPQVVLNVMGSSIKLATVSEAR